jgi:hypothetical protein
LIGLIVTNFNLKNMEMRINNDGDVIISVENFKTILDAIPNNITDALIDRCRGLVSQNKQVVPTKDFYSLGKAFGTIALEWTRNDVVNIYAKLGYRSIDEDTIGVVNCPYIERMLRSDNYALTISSDGLVNRPWTLDEVRLVNEVFNQ